MVEWLDGSQFEQKVFDSPFGVYQTHFKDLEHEENDFLVWWEKKHFGQNSRDYFWWASGTAHHLANTFPTVKAGGGSIMLWGASQRQGLSYYLQPLISCWWITCYFLKVHKSEGINCWSTCKYYQNLKCWYLQGSFQCKHRQGWLKAKHLWLLYIFLLCEIMKFCTSFWIHSFLQLQSFIC